MNESKPIQEYYSRYIAVIIDNNQLDTKTWSADTLKELLEGIANSYHIKLEVEYTNE